MHCVIFPFSYTVIDIRYFKERTHIPVKWDEVIIRDDYGNEQKARAPVIVTASRATDIPAFFTPWLMNRINRGYAVWHNPFNRARPMYISLEKARVFVFWTKNPAPLVHRLEELDRRDINYYFQYTLNDYEGEGLEPLLPPLSRRIETFKLLSEKIGREKIIWRFDPLILMPWQTPRDLLTRIWHLGNRIKGYTDKLVFSFIDIKNYRKVQNSLVRNTAHFNRESVKNAEASGTQIRELAQGLSRIQDAWKKEGWDIEIASCAEEHDLSEFSIVKNRCIDDQLMAGLFPHDQELMGFIGQGREKPDPIGGGSQLDLFNIRGVKEEGNARTFKSLKDPGQRKACRCICSKDIGMYSTCRHFCVYCYANSSRSIVEKNSSLHSPTGESIIPGL